MKLSPLDIRKHEFTRKVRGYDPEEVKAFTDMVSRQWEEVLDDLRHSQDRVRELEGKIEHYEKVENALHEALESARSGAKRTQEQAEERARLIIEEAELKAEQRLQEVDQRQNKLRNDVTDLARRRDEIVARLRHFLMSELEILARHDEDRPIGFMQLMPSSPAEDLPPAPAKMTKAKPSSAAAKRDERTETVEAEASAEQPELDASDEAFESDETGGDETEPTRGTTYGDLYDRAAESESERETEREARAAETEARAEREDEAEDDEPTWTLRSIIRGEDAGDPEDEDADDPDAEPEPTAPDAEKERIRRILEDLD